MESHSECNSTTRRVVAARRVATYELILIFWIEKLLKITSKVGVNIGCQDGDYHVLPLYSLTYSMSIALTLR